MNAKEMRKIIEEKVIDAQKDFRFALDTYGPDDHETREKSHASCALSELYEGLFGRDEFEKLMEKHFPEIFKD